MLQSRLESIDKEKRLRILAPEIQQKRREGCSKTIRREETWKRNLKNSSAEVWRYRNNKNMLLGRNPNREDARASLEQFVTKPTFAVKLDEAHHPWEVLLRRPSPWGQVVLQSVSSHSIRVVAGFELNISAVPRHEEALHARLIA